MEIEFGLKVMSNKPELVREMNSLHKKGVISYAEIYYLFGTDIGPFNGCSMPLVVHCDHTENGLNICDNGEKRFEMLDRLLEASDTVDAKYVIIHAGFGERKNAIEFLERADDKRIILENMPKVGINNERMIGFDEKEMKALAGERFSTCLDFSHAARASVSLKRSYNELVLGLMELNPKMFHLSDADFRGEKDNHMKLGRGELDLRFVRGCIEKNRSRMVTMETPKSDMNSFKEDLENIGYFKRAR